MSPEVTAMSTAADKPSARPEETREREEQLSSMLAGHARTRISVQAEGMETR
jgi:hypothetical protein